MADQIDAPMNPMQTPLADAVSDGPAAQTQLRELRPGDQPALAPSSHRDPPIESQIAF